MHQKRRLCLAVSLALSIAPAIHAQTAAPAADDATTLDRLVVRAQLESQVRSIDVKRDADAIQDVAASDSLGNYPDQNVAESLSRLPGVSVTRDQGEGRFVVVRGLDAALNSVTVDGIAVGTPESDTRSAPMDVIPSESTERLKVVKSPTPDMPGDSIGGSIQVESASAFDRDGRSIRAKLEGSHQQLSGKDSPKASFNYSDLFNDNTFGIALGLSYQDRKFQSDNTEGEYDTFDGGAEDDLFPVSLERRKYNIERKRMSGTFNLDWHPDEDNRYYLRTLYSQFDDAETRQRTVFAFGDADEITALGNGSYAVDGLPSDAISKRVRFRTKKENTFAISAGGENKLGDATLDYKLGYTKTRERSTDEKEARFEYDADDLSATVQTGGIPRFTLSDDGWMGSDNYEFDRLVLGPKWVDDDEYSAQVNVRFDGEHSSYKFGLLGRWRDRDVDVDETELRRGPDIDLSTWASPAPRHRRGTLGEVINSSIMRDFWNQHRNEFSERPQDVDDNRTVSLLEDYTASEDILATYAMGTWDIGALRIIGGVRMENTQFSAIGNQVDFDEDDETLSVSRIRANRSYTSVLPGLHLRYDAGDDWVFRGAYTKTISRPPFGAIAPHAEINREFDQDQGVQTGDVELGNPDLNPYKSDNLDLSVEKYIGKTGILSLGLFHKSIDDYIVEATTRNDPQYPGFNVTRSINGNKAKVNGVEFNWQQQLDFLPEGWNGFLVGFSGTWLDTDFDPGIADRQGEEFTLPRASKRVFSGNIGYEKYGFSARVAAVYRSEYLEELGDSRAYDIYVAPNTQLDFSMDYQIADNVQLYLDASNLLDKPLELYQGMRSRMLQYEEYGRTYAIGVKVSF